MSEPLISVVVITYNHEKYISEAILSIINQNCSYKFEIIIGEDCSTDNTRKIVSDYALKFPEKIKLQLSLNNIGAVQNEYKCIQLAKGKYIAFCEGDDYWTDAFKLQKQIDFLEANPDYGLVHGDVNHYYENTGKTEFGVNKLDNIKIPVGFVFHELLKPNPLFIKTATSCFRKELLISHFSYDKAIQENWPLTDLPIWMDISFHSKVHYFDEVFATYRLLNESASRTSSPAKKYNYFKNLYKIKLIYLEKYNCNNKIKNELEEDYYRNLMKMAFLLNDNSLAKESYDFLKEKKLIISSKELLMLLSTKYYLLRQVIILFKPKT